MSTNALKKLLDEALTAANIAWWEWDIPTNTVVCNELKLTPLGYDPADFTGKGCEAYVELLHPEDQQRAIDAMVAHIEGRAQTYTIDYRIRAADGSYHWYMDRGCVIARDVDGQPAAVRGVVVDLGAAFGARDKHEALLETFRDTGTIADADNQPMTVCVACKKLKLGALWVDVDEALATAFPQAMSHGMCDACLRRLYPSEAEEILRNRTDPV